MNLTKIKYSILCDCPPGSISNCYICNSKNIKLISIIKRMYHNCIVWHCISVDRNELLFARIKLNYDELYEEWYPSIIWEPRNESNEKEVNNYLNFIFKTHKIMDPEHMIRATAFIITESIPMVYLPEDIELNLLLRRGEFEYLANQNMDTNQL